MSFQFGYDILVTDTDDFAFTPREIAMFQGHDLFNHDLAMGYITSADLECYKKWIDNFSRNSPYWHYLAGRFNVVGLVTVSYVREVFYSLCTKASQKSYGAFAALLRRPVYPMRCVAERFYHVESEGGTVTFGSLLEFLAEIEYGDSLVGMSAADLIAQAKVANASTMAAGIASAAFLAEHSVTKKINVTMSPADRELLANVVGFTPIYDPKTHNGSDHTVVSVCRDFIREAYDKLSKASNTKSKTLVVGASYREISRYFTNPAVDYYIFGGEGKDAARITVQALEKVKQAKWKALLKKQRDLIKEAGDLLPEGARQTTESLIAVRPEIFKNPKIRTYMTMQDLLLEAKEAENIPAQFLFDVPDHRYSRRNTYSTLLFEDVGYNFSERNWLEIFRRTNAQVGYGYMLLPFELIFPKLPKNKLYRYHEQEQRYWQGIYKPQGGFYMHSDYSSSDGYVNTTVASVTYSQANGYMHPKAAWSLLLRKGIISADGFDFGLEVELVERHGPMVAFTLTKVTASTSVVRTIALPESMQYLQLMDLIDMAERLKKNPRMVLADPYPYFSVNKREFDSTVNYLLSLDIKSLTLTNTITYVRRNVGGASLVTKELIRAWNLDTGDINRFSQAVFHYTVMLRHMAGDEVQDIVRISVDWREKIINLMRQGLKAVVEPLTFLWSWLWTDRLTDKLVVTMSGEQYQTDHIALRRDGLGLTGSRMFDAGFSTGPMKGTISSAHLDDGIAVIEEPVCPKREGVHVTSVSFGKLLDDDGQLTRGVSYADVDFSDCVKEAKNPLLEFLSAGGKLSTDEDLFKAYLEYYQWKITFDPSDCDVCEKLRGKMGSQIVECMHKGAVTTHNFGLSQTDVDDLRNNLMVKAQESPDILAKVLMECRDNLPRTAFSTEVEVEYIKGGPGCGKSYIIRTLADKDLDLVACPYLKVRSDYQNISDADGDLYSYNFQTQHKMLGQSGKLVVFVDEFTAMDYSLLSSLLYRCGTKRVYLVGDEQQTGIQEGSNEGVNIINRVDLKTMRTHVPIVNFRNPRGTVSLLNYLYGYRMLPASKEDVPILFGDTKDFAKHEGATFMHYSWNTAEVLKDTPDHSGKTSVRCNQGSTWKDVVLPVTESDTHHVVTDTLNIVALSRHKRQLTILLEGGYDNAQPASAALRDLIVNVPEEVHRKDYNLRLYLGLTQSRETAAEPIESAMLKDFRRLVLLHDGYVPYDQVVRAVIGTSDTSDTESQSSGEKFFDTVLREPVGLPVDLEPEVIAASQHVLTKTTCDAEWDALLSGGLSDFTEQEEPLPRANDTLLPAIAAALDMSYMSVLTRLNANRFGRDFVKTWLARTDLGQQEDVSFVGRLLGCSITVAKVLSDGESKPFVHACLGNTKMIYLTLAVDGTYKHDLTSAISLEKRPVVSVGQSFLEKWVYGAAKRTAANRENNCLLVAIARTEYPKNDDSIEKLSGLLARNDRSNYYNRWLQSDRMSDELDCLAFAMLLRKTINVVSVEDPSKMFMYGNPKWPSVTITYFATTNHYDVVGTVRYTGNLTTVADFCNNVDTSTGYLLHEVKAGEVLDVLNRSYNTTPARTAEINKQRVFKAGELYAFEPSESVTLRTVSGHIIGGNSFELRKRDEECVERIETGHGLRPGFVDYALEFMPNIISSYEVIEQKMQDVVVYPKMCKPSRDAHLLTGVFELDPGSLEYNLDYLNQECDSIIGDKFVSGTFDTEMLCPVNMRGHPQVNTVKYRALTMGPANHYFKRSEMQTLKVLQTRYLAKRTSQHMTVNGVNTAAYIGKLFVEECMQIDHSQVFSDENICTLIDKSLQSMVLKNYEKQMDENFTDGARVYRFTLKDIAKPIKETIDVNKAGQGISAWSKIAQVKFMTAHRIINDILIKGVKTNVVYDNSFSEEEFLDRANKALSATPGTSVNGVIDATACDSGQNKFTMEIERTIMRHMGISELFLDWYFMHRENYILQSAYVRAKVSNVKTSGEPATLFGNTILMASIMNALLRGEGPFAIMMKGDDGIKRQSNLNYNKMLLAEIKNHCDLDFKVDLGVPIQFCGYALEKGILVACVVRKLMKVAAHKFRDYEHFKEYQISLRDWVSRIPTEQPAYEVFLTTNAQVVNCEPSVIEHLLDQIVCFSHIGKTEFETLFKLREVSMSMPVTGLQALTFDAKSTKFNTPFMASIVESL